MNMSLTLTRRFLIALAVWMSASAALHAATYYVATTGNDAASGSAAAPFRTIQHGVNAASPGDTVLVAPGVYDTGTQTTTPASGKSRVVIRKAVTVRSTHGAAQTMIKGQANSPTERFGDNSIRCVYMTAGTLDGFTLANGYANARAAGTDMTDPVKNGGGVYAPDNNRTPQVNNCIITQCGAYRGGGAHWATLNNCTVVGNYVNTTSGGGVFSCHVRNSIVYFNTGKDGDNNYSWSPSSTEQSLFSFSCTTPAPGVNYSGQPRDGGGNVTDDPLFSNLTGGVLSLTDASPCINAGSNPFASGARDASGAARVQGGTVDMGAYERSTLMNELVVVNGSGSGSYSNGASVAISANPTSAWTLFAGWTGDTATVADISATNTLLTMPAHNITVTATYRTLTLADYLGETLGIPQPVTTDNIAFDDVTPAVPEVMLGGIGDGQTAFFSTVYTNAGTLLFQWSVSSEEGYDELRLLVDGVVTQRISGQFYGVVTQQVVGAGAHTIRWEYNKDDSGYDYLDAGWVGPILWIPEPLSAELGVSGQPIAFPNRQPGKALPFPYGFEACFLDTAAPAGAAAGAAVKLGGLNAQGTPYFADGTTNSVEVVLQGAGTFSFSWCTSNQPSDIAVCTIDGVEVARRSGKNADWVTITTNLTTVGQHVVRWSYIKGDSGFYGADAVWIDAVAWLRASATLTVQSGSGSGTYPVGETVTLTADPAPAGQEFDGWSGDTGTLADPVSPDTTLVMPATDITVRALYRTQTLMVTVINGRDAGAWPNAVYPNATGEPEGAYPAGAQVRVVANPAPLWQTFDHWEASPAVTFENATSDVTMFTMPAGSVTVTARFRNMTPAERLGDALTIRGQRLDVTAFSPSGVVAVAGNDGGIRYNDPAVRMGGPDVGAGQSVYLTLTNFTGNGHLGLWWHGDTENAVDGLSLEVNGVPYPLLGTFSDKDTNVTDNVRVWWGGHLPMVNVSNITVRYTCDESYSVHGNYVLLDRLIWIPQDMVIALSGSGACVPNINQEYDPLFLGRGHTEGGFSFEGEDGGVAWVTDAPGGVSAVRFGRFGYVTNNLFAQASVTNYGTGRLSWQWTSDSEGEHDNLGFFIDGTRTNWISGKFDGYWYFSEFTVTSDRFEGKDSTLSIFNFRYQKDDDVSMFNDCAWLRGVNWEPSYKVTLHNGHVTSGVATEPDFYLAGAPIGLAANAPEPGYYFDRWTGTNAVAVLGSDVTNPTPIFTMPAFDIDWTATFTTNAPPIPLYTLTVTGGSGSGSYTNGQIVAIAAAMPSMWHSFQGWTGDTDALDDPSAPETFALIGTSNLTVTANFDDIPVDGLLQAVLGIPPPVTFSNITASSFGADSVTLGPLADNDTAFFTTVYTNAGTVIFPWAVDSEDSCDILTFSVDGTPVFEVSGKQKSGIFTNYVAGSGPHTLRWEYTKDISYSAGADCAMIGVVTWISDALAEELGTPGRILYAPDGYDAILLDTAPPAGAIGGLAVRLGGSNQVDHGSSVTVGTVFSGIGTLAFRWSVSSEANCDFLILMIDGQEAARISGKTAAWTTFETNLTAFGEHAVQWIYSKDVSDSSGLDCGWIDSVTWTSSAYTLILDDGATVTTNAFEIGIEIPLNSAPAAAGMEFHCWDGDLETVSDPASPDTTLVMPSRDIKVRALYRAETFAVTVVNGRDAGAWPNAVHESTGEPEGRYPEGAEIRIVADPAPLWYTFETWTAANGSVIADPAAPITTFVMPAGSETLTANYRPQTQAEQLAGALTIAGQPLDVTDFSPNGVVALSSGGVRHNDPVVKFGGQSVAAGQYAQIVTTNFTGDGVLLFWFKGSAETAYDEIQVYVNGTTRVGRFSGKGEGWWAATNYVSGATSITLRFQRDGSYFVRDNTIVVDRVIWLPQALLDAAGGLPCIPDINGEGSISSFDGEDGGVAWDPVGTDGLGGIRLGRFGYVNNDQHAKLSITNYGPGVLMWRWAASSEAVADRLFMWPDGAESGPDWNHYARVSGKEGTWSGANHVIKNTGGEYNTQLHTFLFDFEKDEDVSVLQDCTWLRNVNWTPIRHLTLESATNTAYLLPAGMGGIAALIEEAKENNYPQGTRITIRPDDPEDGEYFDSWEGDIAALVLPVTTAINSVLMPGNDVTLRATYTTNAPSPGPGPAPIMPPKIKALSLQHPAVAPAGADGQRALAIGQSTLVSVLYDGQPQTDYTLEWTPSLTTANWQPLTVIYREVLGDTTDGRRQVLLSAEIPENQPQGFFRVHPPVSP